jgi:hypothetical protein
MLLNCYIQGMRKIIPIPPVMIQRRDSAEDQLDTVMQYIWFYCKPEELENSVKRMIAERLGCYDAADAYFPKRNDNG